MEAERAIVFDMNDVKLSITLGVVGFLVLLLGSVTSGAGWAIWTGLALVAAGIALSVVSIFRP